ncbi:acetyl-CoA carboxylase biotin carboxyl carrier protein [Paenibacillus sp. P26]|nr:acetyl-CoA carboxylase biotin carboxyl carrier protein [Paenibacillus sp. P26]UUZ93597.1 acetyl-CoA carboxylase biotin carboxyl carrier protein [Paenibacillus sp. P25]
MTNLELQEIIKLVSQSPIRKFEFSSETTKILIEKAGAASSAANEDVMPQEGVQESVASSVSEVTGAAQAPAGSESPAKSKNPGTVEIVSPMVGTFYSSSGQGAAPYVQVGDKVGHDTIVCVLEAMKLFNEIAAKTSGEIVQILVQDGDFVEYGQPLFLVKPE